VTIQALKSGCHVLCEKPLADTMSNARKMIAAARRTKKVFAVIQNRRYDANIRRLRGFLASGAIGKITTVQSNFFLARHFGGFRDRMEHVLLLDMAIHTFDAARFIAGADPVSVYCHEWNPKGSWYDHDAAAVAVFEMTGGIVYTYQGSWCAYGLPTKWEADWRVIGQKGSVRWDGAADFTAQAVTDEMASPPKYVDVPVPEISCPGKSGGHAGLIADFLDCIRTRRTPETVGADNVRSLAMVHGAIASASRKRRVAIEA
jgi:predicted dehydrogenase